MRTVESGKQIVHDQLDIRIYYIRLDNKAYYTLTPPDIENKWEVNPEYVLPYLLEFPDLFNPQTIH